METIPAKSEESVDARILRSDDPLAVSIEPQYLSRATSTQKILWPHPPFVGDEAKSSRLVQLFSRLLKLPVEPSGKRINGAAVGIVGRVVDELVIDAELCR